jgi:hypothetical protein
LENTLEKEEFILEKKDIILENTLEKQDILENKEIILENTLVKKVEKKDILENILEKEEFILEKCNFDPKFKKVSLFTKLKNKLKVVFKYTKNLQKKIKK